MLYGESHREGEVRRYHLSAEALVLRLHVHTQTTDELYRSTSTQCAQSNQDEAEPRMADAQGAYSYRYSDKPPRSPKQD